MKKHDADATYQFSCSICGKKFEKKDCVVAHKAKSHPEVLIAEALAANAGALITTPASMLELPANPVQAEVPSLDGNQAGPASQGDRLSQEVGQQAAPLPQIAHVAQPVNQQVVLLGQDQNLHTMQVPVTIALSPIDPPSPADQQAAQLQLQMPVQFVHSSQPPQQPQMPQLTLHSGAVVSQPQPQLQPLLQPQLQPLQSYSSQQQSQTQILQMTFQPVSQPQSHIQQMAILATSQPLQSLQTGALGSPLLPPSQSQETVSTNGDSFILDTPVGSLQQAGGAGGDGVVWEETGQCHMMSDGAERRVQQDLM